MNRYEWRDGARIQLDAQTVGEHLAALEQHAPLTAEAVLHDARGATSPTHDHFEWNDRKAAHEHRLEQARGLIRAVVVVVRSDSPVQQEPIRVRAFTHVANDERRYVPTARALGDKELRQKVLAHAYAELKGIRQKYATLKELASVLEAIDSLTLDLEPKEV